MTPVDYSLPGSSVHGRSPGKNTGVGCHALLRGTFPTQGSNPGLPCFRWLLYSLSHQGSPRILEWVAMPSSGESFQHRDQTQVSITEGEFFTMWATREVQEYWSGLPIPSPGDLPNLGIEYGPPALQVDSLPSEPPGKLSEKVRHKNVIHILL